jgi:serine/threonine protein kinase
MNESQVFAQAVKLTSSTERAAYLDTACAGDPQLRAEVEALLGAHASDPSFLERPAAALGETVDTLPPEADAYDLGFLAASDRPGIVGQLGHYQIQDVIGQGGMGMVLKAFDEQLHRVVAIKVMAARLAANGTARKRFIREAQAAAAVSHDHVVAIHAIEEVDGLPFLVMHYVAGKSLQERIDRDGPLPLAEVLRIGMQVASGLAAAHAQGLVHRDIKPANILLENGVERVKITDFGLARAVDDVKLTQSGMIAGSPQYMSPEQAEGLPVDPRSDLFSLGSVLYAMCTGRPPFRATSTVAVLKQVSMDRPRPIQETNPEVPLGLVEIIAKLHAKDPAQRFQSAAEVAELLGRHLAELQQPTGSLRTPLVPKRRWHMAAAAILLLAVGLGLLEAVGVTRLVPALDSLRRTVSGPAQPSGEELPAAAVVTPQAEGRPQLLTPAEGTLLSNGVLDMKKVRVWEFRWAPVAEASRYHLHVIGPTGTIPLINNPNLTVPSYRFTDTGYAPTTALSGWRWKVRAMVNREWAEWSEERSFDVEPPGPPSGANPPAAAPTLAALKQGGITAFGFPQAQATVLCDTADLRVSLWNNRTYLCVQAILWKDGDDALLQAVDGKLFGNTSTVVLDVDADGKITPQVDRIYSLNPWPKMHGLYNQVYKDERVITFLQQSDTKGRGAIRYLSTADGARVRVDSLVIPLAEINKRPGDKLRLAYWGASPKSNLTLNSVGYQGRGTYFSHQLPWDKFHEVTLADRADVIDPRTVPDGRDDPNPLMQPATRPFVLLARDGRTEQRMETLAEAVRFARGGDTIEVRGNGPFLQEPIAIQKGHAVRIRAGEGFRPVFHVSQTTSPMQLPAPPEMIESRSPLVLEGLEFQQIGPEFKVPLGRTQSPIVLGFGPLYVANCRFIGGKDPSAIPLHAFAPLRCEVCNCQLVSGGGGFSLYDNAPSRIVLRNNVIAAAKWPLHVHINVVPPAFPNADLQLTGNTLVGRVNLVYTLNPKEPPQPEAGAPKALRFAAAGNVFDGSGWRSVLSQFVLNERPKEWLQQWVSWKGDRNFFVSDDWMSSAAVNGKDTQISANLAEWRQFWNDAEIGSVQQKTIRYLNGDIQAKLREAAEQLTPADFRLHPESAGPDSKNLGADVDLVGPGPAYERWKKTAAYQEWLKVTEQALRSGEEKSAGVVLRQAEAQPFVLLARDGRAERSLETLAEAVQRAQAGDTIEVRGNGPFLQEPIVISQGHAVRIRAGEGFRPVFHSVPREQGGFPVLISSLTYLVLEGLEFQQINPNRTNQPTPRPIVDCMSGDPLYVANCRFVGSPYGGSRVISVAFSSRCEVCNCQLIGTWGLLLNYQRPNRTVLRSNVIVTREMPLEVHPAAEVDLQLTRNTIVGKIAITLGRSLDTDPPADPMAGAAKRLRIEASGNIFDGTNPVYYWSGRAAKPAELAELLQRRLSWKGDHNLFSPLARLAVQDTLTETPRPPNSKVPNRYEPSVISDGLTSWRQFWGDKETGSVEGGCRYRGGDIRGMFASDPEQLTPEALRLHPESAGRGARPGGQDVGADVDLVGPGPAYERWKKTPEYQDWLKVTGQTK